MQKLKVLIADDNPRMASMIQNILMDDDEIQVVGTAEDGVETLGMIEETEPDLLLLDLIMPKLDGLGVMEPLQENAEDEKGAGDYCGVRYFAGTNYGYGICLGEFILLIKTIRVGNTSFSCTEI